MGTMRMIGATLAASSLLAACGSDGDEPTADQQDPAGGGTAVEIVDFAYEPEELTVPAGATVTWTNRDSAAHTIEDDSGLFDESADLQQGDELSTTYDQPGTYPYFCGIHNFMTAVVVVE